MYQKRFSDELSAIVGLLTASPYLTTLIGRAVLSDPAFPEQTFYGRLIKLARDSFPEEGNWLHIEASLIVFRCRHAFFVLHRSSQTDEEWDCYIQEYTEQNRPDPVFGPAGWNTVRDSWLAIAKRLRQPVVPSA